MGDYRLYNGLIVPSRDADKIVRRRVLQADRAIKALPLFVEKWRVCVEAGGNWGLWPLRLADMFETVYTFEPDHACFTALVNNCRHKPNVVAFQAALGYARALVGMRHDDDTTGNQNVEGDGIYPVFQIDSLGLPVCDLIYLDIEGMEIDALIGATATILRCHPIVIFEVTRKLDPTNRTEAYMRKYGYFKLGSIGRDLVMGPEAPQGDFGIKNYDFNEKGEMVEAIAC